MNVAGSVLVRIQQSGPRQWKAVAARGLLALWLCACTVVAGGCGGEQPAEVQPRPPAAAQRPAPVEPVVESRALAEVGSGQAYHLVDHVEGGDAPSGTSRAADGRLRMTLGDARVPVIAAPAPYVIRQRLQLGGGAKLRLAFGLTGESRGKRGGGVRFTVRVIHHGRTVEALSEEARPSGEEAQQHWQSREIPLGEAGDVTLELATEMTGAPGDGSPEDYVGAYALWANPVVVVPSERERPNIVLVVIDALRPDRLGCYGYDRATSPFLDELAAKGTVFENAHAQGTWTFASVPSLLTSSYRFVRGTEVAAKKGAGPDEETALAPVTMAVSLQEALRRAGYTTLACVGGGYMWPELGFDWGFDWYWSPRHQPMVADQVGAMKRRLSEDGDSPFFLLFHTYEIHNYFQGWAHCIEHFDHGYLGPLTDPRRLAQAVFHTDPAELSAADLQYIWDLYDGEVRHTDRYLGLFFEWLLSQPWGENTVVVVTADHGEALGGHGVMSHGGMPYREVVRVPLVMALPDGRFAGRRVEAPVSLVDVMPTLLDIARAQTPDEIVGRSLLPAMRGREWEPKPVYCEGRGSAAMAREGNWWYITCRGKHPEELYDMGRDPTQRRNLAAAAPERLRRMREVFAGLAMQAVRGYRLVAAGEFPDGLTVRLRSDAGLGYLDAPTAQKGDRLTLRRLADPEGEPSGWDAVWQPSARSEPQVLLFEPEGDEVEVSAEVRGKAVPPSRFHLGETGEAAESPQIMLGGAARALFRAEEPPVPQQVTEWGLWLWLPPRAAQARPPAITAGMLPEEMRDQLKTLGYLR